MLMRHASSGSTPPAPTLVLLVLAVVLLGYGLGKHGEVINFVTHLMGGQTTP